MVGPRVYHIKHARAYPAFTASDPAKVMDLATKWLSRHDFRIKRKNRQYSRGSKRGIHVNFVPKFKLYIEQGTNGQYVVRFDYYAKIKIGTAVVVGVLTSGISTVIGVGTLAVTLADADHFVDKFWKHIDSLARGNPVILTMERWASDGKGNFVQQPVPGGPVAVAAVPGPQVNPSLVKQQSQSGNARVVSSSQLPHPAQHVAHPSQTSHPAYAAHASYPQGAHHVPAQAYYGAPQQPPPQLYYPPPPPPMPQQTPPSNIQPGQVYGHNALRQTQSIAPSAPPVTPSGYPPFESAPSHVANGYPTSSHAWYPPAPPQHAYPPAPAWEPTTRGNPSHLSQNSHIPPPPPPMPSHLPAHEYEHPPPLPPKPATSQSFTSQHNHPAPYASHHSLPASSPHYPPAPTAAQRNGPAPSTSQHNHPPPQAAPRSRPASPTSQRSYAPPQSAAQYPPAPSTHGYPSPPSAVHSNHREPVSAALYPSLSAQSSNTHAYPPAPSITGSDTASLRSEDMARMRIDDVAQNRRPPLTGGVGSRASFFEDLASRQGPGDKPNYKGEQQAKNINRMSQYDMQYPIGENKSFADNTSLYQDFNHADTQSLKKSSETYNPWESSTLAATRQESLARGLEQDRSGIAKH
eukprot:Phypoly_transcript_04830.p1 GENE.Phypoly_transcript_04830~~Phypoly_transcript_04830.p1  ORF type:complete len:633 (+),score=116.44 Phypoly_transcript_04830:123-2021(+)